MQPQLIAAGRHNENIQESTKNQISKAAVATFINDNLLTPSGLSSIGAGDVELVT